MEQALEVFEHEPVHVPIRGIDRPAVCAAGARHPQVLRVRHADHHVSARDTHQLAACAREVGGRDVFEDFGRQDHVEAAGFERQRPGVARRRR